ncbi:MAG TPA: hypothetical protein VGO15_07440, partial [Candidatus Limnocylindrales bacterium]|nr:hypothetical protein [Candidatus Limnocylindrales bacterium]
MATGDRIAVPVEMSVDRPARIAAHAATIVGLAETAVPAASRTRPRAPASLRAPTALRGPIGRTALTAVRDATIG